jgi:PIN domain nuclease of toxin-antitoxin system
VTAAPLIDTHIWIWWVEGASDLSRLDREALDALEETERPHLSAISLWELSVLIQKGRYTPGRDMDTWLALAAGPAAVTLAPINVDVARELMQLPRSIHADPADRIIVATARALDVPLLTYDNRIRRSGLVQLWKVK